MKPLATRLNRLIPTSLWWATLLIIAALPFHVLAYSLLLAHLHPLAGPFKDWKEALTVLMLLAAGGLAILKPKLTRQLIRRPEFWLIGLFSLLNVLFAIRTPDHSAAVLAIKINIIFLLLFAAAWVATAATPKLFRERWLIWCLLIPAAIVGLFGLAQLWLLPANFLVHFGYGKGPGQISPYEIVANSSILRIQSFLFGPNQFGSYLALPLMVAGWATWRYRSLTGRLAAAGLFIVLLINLYGTESRGSWVGVLAGLFALVWLLVAKTWRWILAGGLAIALVAFLLLLPTLTHSRFATQILHQSSQNAGSGDIDGSTGQHFSRLSNGLHEFEAHPWGQNLTVVGRPSDLIGDSFYTENFYLQIADQIGIEGLALFVAILILIGIRLAQAADTQPLAIPFLAALVGISVMNLFSQTWSDGATALLWWGGAGLILGTAANKDPA